MKIIEFYNKGAQVVIEGSGGGMNSSFSSGGGDDVQLGYVPTSKAKVVEGPAHDTLEHGGKTYLLLRGGYVYSIVIGVGDTEKQDVISAEHGHIALPLPGGAEVVAVSEAK